METQFEWDQLVDALRVTASDIPFQGRRWREQENSSSDWRARFLARVSWTQGITIEDPIEFEFQAKQAEIIQREIGLDSPSYDTCLRKSLRQNPDILVIGEIRDAETAIATLQAAETGHLVIGSLHADSVVESIYAICG